MDKSSMVGNMAAMFRSIKRLAVSYAAASEIGTRERNEDAIIALESGENFCFVVADGLGGHGFGDVASKLLVASFERNFYNASDNLKFLARTFDDAQNEIISAQSAEGLKNQMKTTAVALSIIGGKLAWGHVGDSRIYHFKRGKLVSRTIDHSVSQMLALAKEIDESEIASHPDRSRLLRAFGDKWDAPRYELSKEISLRRDSAFLLCSDGVWEHLPGGNPPAPQCDDAQRWISDMFTDVAGSGHQTGDNDNYSAIAVIVK